MITNLRIQNYTLIDELDIDLYDGFSVITGETGAGKSIILGALNILLGHRADSKSVKEGKQRCIVEAHFNLTGYNMQKFFADNDLDYEEHDCILRRELTATGKSRAFINDTPVQLTLMRELGEQLVDIHSQHQNLLLRDSDFQLFVTDTLAGNRKILDDYRSTYNRYCDEKHKLEAIKSQARTNVEQEEYLRFICNELGEAKLHEDEQEELEQRAEMMTHTEDIKHALYTADNLLSNDETGIVQNIKQATNAINGIASIYDEVSETAERLESTYVELRDIQSELSSLLDKVDFDPQEQQMVNDRLDLIYSLQRKHHKENVSELIAYHTELKQQLLLIDNSDEEIERQQHIVEELLLEAKTKASVLTERRHKAAKKIEKQMVTRLMSLGMPNVQFITDITPSTLSLSGADKISFLFSANRSTSPQPVASIASGGEIARVMLSLKAMISNAVSLPTIIFDEIDTGVSGKIAESMAQIMQEMGNADRQVISITHLPQIASLGSHHYKVAKQETSSATISQMTELSPEQRINEIAQMLSGATISDSALQQAKELLRY